MPAYGIRNELPGQDYESRGMVRDEIGSHIVRRDLMPEVRTTSAEAWGAAGGREWLRGLCREWKAQPGQGIDC